MERKTIEVSEDLYNAVQKLKEVFHQLTGQEITKDEDVLSILIGGFIDSLNQSAAPQSTEVEQPSGIITE
ncbi:MAG: hypothetical protein WCJ81_05650 [bacterium]